MRTIQDIIYDDRYDECKLDIYIPDNSDYKTIVYMHGGCLSSLSKSDANYVEIAKSFVNAGYGFVSIEYRKYPKAKFPDYLIDCAKAVKWVENNIKFYGGNGEIIMSGQSAGAWICLMLCFDKEYFEKSKVKINNIIGWIIDSAQTTSHFNVIQKELGLDEFAQRIDKYAPLFYINKETQFSKMFLVFYDNDMPCRLEQNMLLYKNILAYNKNANICFEKLNGTHCAGSTIKDTNGEYPFVKTALSWLSKNI